MFFRELSLFSFLFLVIGVGGVAGEAETSTGCNEFVSFILFPQLACASPCQLDFSC